jgi:hypothetical protein
MSKRSTAFSTKIVYIANPCVDLGGKSPTCTSGHVTQGKSTSKTLSE